MKSNLKIIRGIILNILFAIFLTACGSGDGGGSGSSSPPPPDNYTAFSNPEIVTINGYNGNMMEPFISRDGTYLFFNDSGPARDIYYATFINETTFQYQEAITAINTAAVDGVSTMDVTNTFFYVSTANYNPPIMYDTLYTGTWDGSTVNGSTPVTGLAITTPGFINFDIEVSPDGSTLYFNDGDFTGGNTVPDAANIAIAVKSGSGFTRDPNSVTIMANVNTNNNLEYAPAISADGLELFFTRFNRDTSEAHIYRAIRSNTSSPFEVPQLVSAIEGQVEGPTLSPDEKSLYYHKVNTQTGIRKIYRVTRQ
jgi:hypothetical protein